MTALFPYQDTGATFLAQRQKALLADTMGLGKSAQAITACDKVGARSIIVLCPASVRINWQREFSKFSAMHRKSVVMLTGKASIIPNGINICSYDLLSNEKIFRALMQHEWDALILDEEHYLKGRDTKRTKSVFGPRCDATTGLASKAKRIWALSGTPAPNNMSELYPLLRAFNIWKTGYWPFVERYCTGHDSGFGFQITGAKNVPELKALLQPIMLRRKIEDIMSDLPPVTFSEIVLDPKMTTHPDDQKAWMDAEASEDGQKLQWMLDHLPEDKIDLEGQATALATLRKMTGMAKVRPAVQLIEDELRSGLDKVVIFAIHRDVIMYLRECLKPFGVVVIWGGTDAEKRQNHIDRFRTKGGCRVFIGQVKAAGTGVDGLQDACSNVVFVESSWTPSENAQAVGRVRRIGQKRPVLVRFVSLANSIDEHVQRVLSRKTQMLTQLFD